METGSCLLLMLRVAGSCRAGILVGAGVVGSSFIGHGGLVAVVVRDVVDNLNAAVGKGDLVGATRDGVGTLLLSVEVGACVLVGHAVREGVGTFLKWNRRRTKKGRVCLAKWGGVGGHYNNWVVVFLQRRRFSTSTIVLVTIHCS